MARRNVTFASGEYYHIYNRGVNRDRIFRSDANYRFLLGRLKTHARNWKVSVIAYCLMPNHYHLVLRQDSEQPIGGFMQAVFNSYTKAFNKMYARSGTLFEGPYRAILISEEAYVVHLCRDIHRNPVEAGLVERPEDWPYSNYLEWIGKRGGTLVDREFVSSCFPQPEAYARFVTEYTPPVHVEDLVKRISCE